MVNKQQFFIVDQSSVLKHNRVVFLYSNRQLVEQFEVNKNSVDKNKGIKKRDNDDKTKDLIKFFCSTKNYWNAKIQLQKTEAELQQFYLYLKEKYGEDFVEILGELPK